MPSDVPWPFVDRGAFGEPLEGVRAVGPEWLPQHIQCSLVLVVVVGVVGFFFRGLCLISRITFTRVLM